jgi:hypothetical protein
MGTERPTADRSLSRCQSHSLWNDCLRQARRARPGHRRLATHSHTDQGQSGTYLKSLGLKGPSDASTGESLSYPLLEREEYTKDYSSDDALLNYPLQRLAPIFRASDLVMVNCEGALSDHGRQVGLNRTPERFAISMREAGIGLVNLANNHTFDAEERGFLDTLRALSLAGIAHVGGGTDLADARKPVIVERNGIRLGFLGYTQFTNIGESSFAADGRPGVAPMDPFLMTEDIRRLRPQVDYVLDDRFHESCHKRGIPFGFRTPTYVACVHRRTDHGSVAAGD